MSPPRSQLWICPRCSHLLTFLDLLALYDVNVQITAIEELIAQGADMRTVVRLLCLASVVLGGIKAKPLENIKREILQVGSLLSFKDSY